MTRRAWFAFALASVIWGVPYLFIKVAVDHGVTAPVLAWGRVTLGALVLLGLAWRAGTLGSLRGRWHWLLAFALAEIVIPFPMLAIGEERVPSSLAAIMVATVPLIGAMLAMRFDHSERPTPIRAFGLLIGFCGVIALVGLDVAGRGGELPGVGAIMLTATGYAIGPMLIKLRLAGLDPRATMGASLALASLVLAPWAALDTPGHVSSARAVGAVAVLGLLCTAGGFVVYAILIGEAGTSRATVITYVNPVVAVALGVALLGEHPGAGAVAGLLLILAGGWLSTDGRVPPGLARLVGHRSVDPPGAGLPEPSTRRMSRPATAPEPPYG
jgi:drug/metabolite transporter (DMT)-like permease